MSEQGKKSGKKSDKARRRKKETSTSEPTEERPTRPTSLELETDWANTETKLVILDFLSAQSIHHLTARNAPEDLESIQPRSPGKVCKSASDGSSHEPASRKRYAKLAKSAKPLRKQYSLRLRKDLDEYLKQRGKSLDNLPSYNQYGGGATGNEDVCMHQRSYTEGDAYLRSSQKISDNLNKGITEFNTSHLRHVEDEGTSQSGKKAKGSEESKPHRPENLNIPSQRERRISPVLSPESNVAARLEMISQDILNTYPDIFDDQVSKVNLQDLTYEKFASTARKLFEKYPGGWTRIALVCYFARELALEDESTDEQLEHLVDFSSRFISETSAEWIASQGGWGALELNDERISPSLVRQKLREEPDLVDGIVSDSTAAYWINYMKYGIAVLAVGVTYSIVSTRM